MTAIGLQIRDLRLSYGATTILDLPDFRVSPGERVALKGPSGSGKTSLIYLLAGIERPSTGVIDWGGISLTGLREGALDRWRRQSVGLIFQDFHLVPGLTALANILLPARFDGWRPDAAQSERAKQLLARVGVADRLVERLSRGEQQRVAVARAALRAPKILLADEPTASLDAPNAAAIGDLILDLADETGATVIIASHDSALLARLNRQVALVGGKIVTDTQ